MLSLTWGHLQMLFLRPDMVLSPLSPLSVYSHFSIREALPEPPPCCVHRAPRASLLEHLSRIINKLNVWNYLYICPLFSRGQALGPAVLLAQCQQIINMWSVDELNECTNGPQKSKFMSEDKWLPSLLAHSFPHGPPNCPDTFVSFLGRKGSVWLS